MPTSIFHINININIRYYYATGEEKTYLKDLKYLFWSRKTYI